MAGNKIKIILATGNRGKVREIKKILNGTPVKIFSLDEFQNGSQGGKKNFSKRPLRKIPHIIENGKTFKENALKKARIIARWSGLPVLADDSGLEVAALGGRPGVKSARFAGPGASDQKLCAKVLRLMKKVPPSKRQARFVCVAALVLPDGRTFTKTGDCRGFIAQEMKGQNGFGYDPIFYYPPLKKNLAELPLSVKNKISHRFLAFNKMKRPMARSL